MTAPSLLRDRCITSLLLLAAGCSSSLGTGDPVRLRGPCSPAQQRAQARIAYSGEHDDDFCLDAERPEIPTEQPSRTPVETWLRTELHPELQNVVPPSALNNTETPITLSGHDFDTIGHPKLWINGVAATSVRVLSETRLTARIPAQPGIFGLVPIRLQNSDGSIGEATSLFSYTASQLDFSMSPVTSGHPLYSFAAGDVNQDGKPDLAVIHDRHAALAILRNDGKGSVLPPQYYSLRNPGASAVALADLNGDKIVDAIVTGRSPSELIVLLGTKSGSFSFQKAYPLKGESDSIAVADLDGDGRPDVAVNNTWAGSVTVFLGDGTGDLRTGSELLVGSTPKGIVAADFNGDTATDLAIANSGDNSISVLLRQGPTDGAFLPAVSYQTGSMPTGLVAVDLNRDSVLDLATSLMGDNKLGVLLGTDRGKFDVARTFSTGARPVSIAAGDLNGDQIPDLATANLLDDDVSILLGDGSGSYGPPSSFPVGRWPVTVQILDLDNDKKPDLAVSCVNSAWVALRLNRSR